jgi:hypothetical protein
LARLPRSGRLRRNNDKHTVMCVSFLLKTVPDSDPLKPEIRRMFEEAASRSRS